jgi:hypothetical protein
MSVKRGHQIIKLLPIEADKETTHTRLYLHISQPYDPPTFINNTLFNAANRPDAKNPLAFHFHLRMGCASEAVLKHTQHHAMCVGCKYSMDHGRNSKPSYLAAHAFVTARSERTRMKNEW